MDFETTGQDEKQNEVQQPVQDTEDHANEGLASGDTTIKNQQ